MTEQHHAVIAGTGRAGTTFLVEFLAACGVPTVDLDPTIYDPKARAGFERSLLDAGDLYLVKDPWLHEYLDEIDLGAMTIDALIVPVRDLRAAAMSRIRQERAAIVESHPRAGSWNTFGTVPGGLTHSLATIDEERLLAVGQAHLLEWAVRHSIQLFMPHFPRLVNDADYTIDVLWPWLSRFCDRDAARAAFERTSSPSSWTFDVDGDGCGRALDESVVTDMHATIEALQLAVLRQREEFAEAVDGAEQLAMAAKAEVDAARSTIHHLEQNLLALDAEVSRLGKELEQARHESRTRSDENEALRSSASWKIGQTITAPTRLVRRLS